MGRTPKSWIWQQRTWWREEWLFEDPAFLAVLFLQLLIKWNRSFCNMNVFALLAMDIDVTHFFLLFNGCVSLFHPSHLEASADHSCCPHYFCTDQCSLVKWTSRTSIKVEKKWGNILEGFKSIDGRLKWWYIFF